MGLSRSLTIGASSLNAHRQKFDVISNNIANANTTGYKSTRANFADQLSQIYKYGRTPDIIGGNGAGGLNPTQYGLGVKVGSITTDMSQGAVETTNRPLDMALNGEGYFVYNLNGQQVYSRAGAINWDKGGNLVDSTTGAILQGYNITYGGTGRMAKDSNDINILNKNLSNLNISQNVVSSPKQTSTATVNGNLDLSMAVGASKDVSINIYDNLGGTKSLNLTFTKQAPTGTPPVTTFGISAKVGGTSVTLPSTSVTFNSDGTIKTPTSLQIDTAGLTALNTAFGGTPFDTTKPININLADPNNLMSGLTSFTGASTANFLDQNGYAQGSLQDISVDLNGKIWGSFTNGVSEILGQLSVAKFENPSALTKRGDNFLSVAPNSGTPNIGTAGEIFPSTSVIGNALESSNVEMTEQFTDMISTQRGYESAARTITVTDQMLQEINQLKR